MQAATNVPPKPCSMPSRRRTRMLLPHFEKVFAPEGGARKTEFAKDDQSHITDAGYRALTAYSVKALAAAR